MDSVYHFVIDISTIEGAMSEKNQKFIDNHGFKKLYDNPKVACESRFHKKVSYKYSDGRLTFGKSIISDKPYMKDVRKKPVVTYPKRIVGEDMDSYARSLFWICVFKQIISMYQEAPSGIVIGVWREHKVEQDVFWYEKDDAQNEIKIEKNRIRARFDVSVTNKL